jgi:hypothetical protein
MAKLEVEITVKGIREVKNICDLLNKYYEQLPKELQDALVDIEKYGISDIDRDVLVERYPNGFIEQNSLNLKQVISVNKVLKIVKILDDGLKTLYPEHFWLKVNDDIIAEW